jgi:hypothetical protein
MYGGGEISRDRVEPVLSIFSYSNEKYDRVTITEVWVIHLITLTELYILRVCN